MDRFSKIPKSKCRVLAACHNQPLCGRGDVDVGVRGDVDVDVGDNVDATDDDKNGEGDVDDKDKVDGGDDDENSDGDVDGEDKVDAGDDDKNGETSNQESHVLANGHHQTLFG